jgi:alpha,alpha-trehalase
MQDIRPSLIGLVLFLAQPALALERPAPPQVLFGDLFSDVQLAPVFPDSKEFADATAKSPPPEILALYHAQKPNSLEGLKRFVVTHFNLPAEASTPEAASEQVPIRRHIDALWTLLTRDEPIVPPYSSLLPLPKPYVVPGGRFRELYYWDSYFVMLGLAESGRRVLLEDMATNFADLIDTYGHAPNGTRTYYLSRSQPPFFFRNDRSPVSVGSSRGLRPLSAGTQDGIRILDGGRERASCGSSASPYGRARGRVDPQSLLG